MATFDFPDFRAYDNWRIGWRRRYRAVSSAIRAAKIELKNYQRTHPKLLTGAWHNHPEEGTQNFRLVTKLSVLRTYAASLLEERAEAKTLAAAARRRNLIYPMD